MIYDKNNEIVPAVDGTKSNLVAETSTSWATPFRK